MREEEFFERVEAVKNRLYKIAYTYSGSESMAVDAVDEAIYKGYMKRKQLKKEQYLETWLTRILINTCNRQYKHALREAKIDFVAENATQDGFDNLTLKLALQLLPNNLKEIVLLYFFGGYTILEVAEILKVPQGTVATRFRKALKLLRLELEV